MTSTPAAPASTWHDGICVIGQPYPTRNYAADIGDDSDTALGLTETQLDYLRAIHESGHAITVLTARAHLHSAEIVHGEATTEVGGITYACHLADGHAYAIYSAAGERAADRWLHEAGLWSPTRAVANEVAAHSDRASFLAINPHVGFGDKDVHYQHIHDLADQALNTHWAAVTAVASALHQHHHLTGDAIAALTGLPNTPYCTA
ncbi:hypothetical protein [Streptomyces olivochromogenes]|uniref:Uncharacterized protein n=1 Tax=Streptomyces olivochromogenes TaxID=1963 RepID=A0A250VT74_STROL|nr:hypothetical protein [Streptomyces olivochromogenes]KUN38262.1 hypothetical protein AQJ27_44995 [Streptomyces olivochromogenes]GAX57296.1 hypothetical protein SO3561_08866 [Streptomyces olivochromogenes]